nr:unnamed protein product [Spirometra erinaceieuropaei]
MEKIVGCVGNPRAFDIARITPEFKDCGRRPHLPKCPVLVLLGGPGSGRTKQALALCSMIPGIKHFNITDLLRTKVLDSLVGGAQKDWDVVAKRVHSSEPPLEYDRLIPEYWDIQVDILREEFVKLANTATMVIIEGYLNDESQIITFNQNIGGADLIVLLDCEESTLNQRLSKRGARIRRVEDEGHIINQRINFFKQVTLPVVRYFDELGKLVIVPADRDADLVTKDLVYLIEYFLAKGRRQANNSAHVEVPIMKNYSNCELDQESAATRIQANFRGYICRKGMQQVGSRQKQDTPKSEVRNPGKKPNSDVQFFFLLGPPGFKKSSLAKRLADEQNLHLIKLKDLTYSEDTNDNIFQRLNIIVDEVGKENTRFLMVGFPMDLEKLSQFKQQVTKNLHILFLDVDYLTAQQRYRENSRLPNGENTLADASFLSNLSRFYEESTVLTEVLDPQTLFHKVDGSLDEQSVLKELTNYVGQARK